MEEVPSPPPPPPPAALATPTLAASALPELNVQARPLDANALVADAFVPEPLARLLGDAGDVVGSEREFFGRSDIFDHVIARSLRFERADGAAAYLGWVRTHARDFLGRAKREPALGLGEEEALFSLLRCDVCKKQQPTFLAVWRRGESVGFLLASGAGVKRDTFAPLARELDERIGP